jgi:hypothetical protein
MSWSGQRTPTLIRSRSISAFALNDDAAGNLRVLGPFAQGPPSVRFAYVNSGKRAGDSDSIWDRRAKVPLTGLTRALIKKASRDADSVIEAKIAGTSRDGGPVCASVALASGCVS